MDIQVPGGTGGALSTAGAAGKKEADRGERPDGSPGEQHRYPEQVGPHDLQQGEAPQIMPFRLERYRCRIVCHISCVGTPRPGRPP